MIRRSLARIRAHHVREAGSDLLILAGLGVIGWALWTYEPRFAVCYGGVVAVALGVLFGRIPEGRAS